MHISENEQNEKLWHLAGDAEEIICPLCGGWIRKDQRPLAMTECACTLQGVKERESRDEK